MSWIKDSDWKSKRKEDLFMTFCAGICHIAKACTLLDQHRKLVGCDLDSHALSAAEPDVLYTFALQVLNLTSDTTVDNKMRAAAQWFKEKVAVIVVAE